jgi:hypothetical protein
VLTNRAGIYQNNIRFFDFVYHTESGLFERGSNQGSIQLVHLTAEAFNKKFQITDFIFHIAIDKCFSKGRNCVLHHIV